eukprot:SAG31_NODE_387_length_16403_cov_5.062071_10_plen_76_part_00
MKGHLAVKAIVTEVASDGIKGKKLLQGLQQKQSYSCCAGRWLSNSGHDTCRNDNLFSELGQTVRKQSSEYLHCLR